MLVLSRKLYEVIVMDLPNGDTIEVLFAENRVGGIRLGIEAPSDVRIRRKELAAHGSVHVRFRLFVGLSNNSWFDVYQDGYGPTVKGAGLDAIARFSIKNRDLKLAFVHFGESEFVVDAPAVVHGELVRL